jgi:hypothetical protein
LDVFYCTYLTTDFTDSHGLVATKTQRHEGLWSALAYSAKVILVPKGLRCPFALSAESRIIRASLYKPSKQNQAQILMTEVQMTETQDWVKRAEVFGFVCRILGVKLENKKKGKNDKR